MASAIKSANPLGFPWQTQDPFLFCAYHSDHYPKGNDAMGPDASLKGRQIGQDFAPNTEGWRMYHGHNVPGFPAHPHRGFETVTIVTDGVVDHSDSLGAAGRFGYGDVQWMTAGKGVQHCEMFPLLNKDKDNPLELFQIWLNLPKSKKLAAPYFAMLWAGKIPMHVIKDDAGRETTVRIVAGALANDKAPGPAPDSWAADPNHEVAIWIIKSSVRATFTLPAAGHGVNRSVFLYKGGSVNIDGENFSKASAIELVADKEVVISNGDEDSFFLMLQGKPIGEPVAQYGPFVMNTQQEIQDAMTEYRKTEFGGWPWPSHEHVHPRDKSRFAKYPDGREESRTLPG
ncbi:MAG: pirin family protein [Chryseolinea sp.]